MSDFEDFNPKEFANKEKQTEKLEDWRKFKLEQEYKDSLKPKKMTKKQKKKKDLYSAIGKIKKTFEFKGKAKSKPLIKKSKLTIKVPYKKGQSILGQRSRYFNEEYEKEKNLLAWN